MPAGYDSDDPMTTLSGPLPQPVRHMTCGHCGEAFECGNGGKDGGCWCMDEAAQLPLPADGGDCLCPLCLRAVSVAQR